MIQINSSIFGCFNTAHRVRSSPHHMVDLPQLNVLSVTKQSDLVRAFPFKWAPKCDRAQARNGSNSRKTKTTTLITSGSRRNRCKQVPRKVDAQPTTNLCWTIDWSSLFAWFSLSASRPAMLLLGLFTLGFVTQFASQATQWAGIVRGCGWNLCLRRFTNRMFYDEVTEVAIYFDFDFDYARLFGFHKI